LKSTVQELPPPKSAFLLKNLDHNQMPPEQARLQQVIRPAGKNWSPILLDKIKPAGC